jgi:hypothetical protein
LEWLLKVKQRQKEEAIRRGDSQRLVTEIEMLKVVLNLVLSSKRRRKDSSCFATTL